MNALISADEGEKKFLKRVTNAWQHLNKIYFRYSKVPSFARVNGSGTTIFHTINT